MISFQKLTRIVWKCVLIGIVTLIGAGITCGGNIILYSSSIGKEGNLTLFLFWYGEIILILLSSIFFFFGKYDHLNPTARKWLLIVLGTLFFGAIGWYLSLLF